MINPINTQTMQMLQSTTNHRGLFKPKNVHFNLQESVDVTPGLAPASCNSTGSILPRPRTTVDINVPNSPGKSRDELGGADQRAGESSTIMAVPVRDPSQNFKHHIPVIVQNPLSQIYLDHGLWSTNRYPAIIRSTLAKRLRPLRCLLRFRESAVFRTFTTVDLR